MNQQIITTINKPVYFNHDVIWCKAARIGEYKTYREEERKMNARFLANPFDSKVRKKFIDHFIDMQIFQNLTPEDFDADYWLEIDWIKSGKQDCSLLMDVMIAKSEITHQEHSDYHNDMAKNAKGHGNQYKFDTNGNVIFDFVDYQKLKQQFLEELFAENEVTFLVNCTLEDIQNEKTHYPAIIGIDANTIGFFWFMD